MTDPIDPPARRNGGAGLLRQAPREVDRARRGPGMTRMVDFAGELERIAEAISRLRPDWRDANRFYEERSDAVGALRALSRNPPATRVVTRFVQVPVPVPAPPSAPTPASLRAAPPRHRVT